MTVSMDDLGSLFESDSIPDGITTSDRTCEVCDAPLSYSGKGRPPTRCDEHKKAGARKNAGSSSGRRSATREVDTALASLDQLNGILATALMFASPAAAAHFANSGQALEDRNRTVLEANPELAKKIAKVTGKTGALGLIISYGMVLVPCVGIMRAEREEEYEHET